MWRHFIIAVLPIAAATLIPGLLQATIDDRQTADDNARPAEFARAEIEQDSRNPLAGRVAHIEADRRGHFIARAYMNGRGMDVLVDTGATVVAINERTARRIGVRVKPDDFRYRVRTANGETSAAAIYIDEIRIGRIIAHDVPASVLPDESLSGILLGMSFLNKLKKFEVESGTLVLTQ